MVEDTIAPVVSSRDLRFALTMSSTRNNSLADCEHPETRQVSFKCIKMLQSHLDSGLEGLDLDGCGLQQAVILHVDDLAGLSIHTVVVLAVCVLGLSTENKEV